MWKQHIGILKFEAQSKKENQESFLQFNLAAVFLKRRKVFSDFPLHGLSQSWDCFFPISRKAPMEARPKKPEGFAKRGGQALLMDHQLNLPPNLSTLAQALGHATGSSCAESGDPGSQRSPGSQGSPVAGETTHMSCWMNDSQAQSPAMPSARRRTASADPATRVAHESPGTSKYSEAISSHLSEPMLSRVV